MAESPTYEDLLYETNDGVTRITINRPSKLNALRGVTFAELADALARAGGDRDTGVIVLTGAGERAFSSGGDITDRTPPADHLRRAGPLDLMHLVHSIPKPIIARVRGYAVGFGNILAFNCDLTLAGESGVFGQNGPRIGSFDPGWGSTYLARIVGQKRAREIWYLCRRYPARDALAMGLINAVVPDEELDAEVAQWSREILALSPSAIAGIKASFNPDIQHIQGVSQVGFQTLAFLGRTDEAREGASAFVEKRPPNFAPFRR